MSKGAKCPNTPNLYTTDNYVITCLRFINLRWIYLAFCLTSQVREVIVLQFNCWNSAVCCFELIKSFVRFCNSIHSFALKNVSLQSYFVEWKSNYWCIKFVTSSKRFIERFKYLFDKICLWLLVINWQKKNNIH